MSWTEDNVANPFARESNNPNNHLLGVSTHSDSPEWLEEQKTQEEDPEVPKMIFYTRMANLILSVLMFLASLLSLITTNSITTGVLACYVVVLSCLLCCYETHLKQVSKAIALNFGFLFSAKSRCIFMVFIASLLFSFSLFGKLVGLAMMANACLNVYVIFKHPTFEDAQRQSAQSDIADFLQSHPELAKRAVAYGVSAGTDYARENPDVARQGAEALFRSQSGGGGNSGGGSESSV